MESVTSSDLKIVYKRYKKAIWFFAFCSSFAVTAYVWKMPPRYEATAMFKDGGIANREKLGLLSQLMGFKSEESNAKAIFYSRKLMEPLIHAFGMQVQSNRNIVVRDFSIDISKAQKDNIIFHTNKAFLESTMEELKVEGVHEEGIVPIKILPLDTVLKLTRKSLLIKENTKSTDILNVSFTHHNPIIVASFVNQLMGNYKEYLRKENEKIVDEQLSFLKQRKQEVIHNINQSLEEHANYLQNNIGEMGFFEFQEVITQNGLRQQEIQKEINALLLEKNALLSLFDHHDNICIDYSPIKDHLIKIQDEKQKLSHEKKNALFFVSHHPTEHKTVGKNIQLVHSIINPMLGKQQPPLHIKPNDWVFGGIDHAMAKSLIMQYQNKMDTLHQLVKKYEYVLNTLTKEPLSLISFGTIFADDTIKQMIESIITIVQKLNETELLSEKEQQLLTKELHYKQKMVIHHLQHLIHFNKLEIEQYEHHNLVLQKHIIKLLDQEIERLSDQYSQEIRNRISLIQEQINYLKNQLTNEREAIKQIPMKWVKEQALEIETQLDTQLLKAVVESLESKNAEQLMMRVMAKPIDLAIIPKHPNPKYLPIIFSTLFIFFLLFYFFMFVGYRLRKGFLIGIDGIRKKGFVMIHKNRIESDSLQKNLEASRLLVNELKKVTLWTETRLSSWMNHICNVIKKEGKEVLIVDCTFTSSKEDDLIFCIDNNKPIPIGKCAFYDLVVTREAIYGLECLKRKEFAIFFDQMKKKYDYIFLITSQNMDHPETVFLTTLAEKVIIPGHNRLKHEMAAYDANRTIILI